MSKEFVEYHSDGACYADGTLPIISKNVGCYNPKTYLFGNIQQTLQIKSILDHNFNKKYMLHRLISHRIIRFYSTE